MSYNIVFKGSFLLGMFIFASSAFALTDETTPTQNTQDMQATNTIATNDNNTIKATIAQSWRASGKWVCSKAKAR